MEYNDPVNFEEEIPLDNRSPEQFLLAAQEAAHSLGWLIHHIEDQLMICQTPQSDLSRGELLRIFIQEGKAVIQVLPMNEYYWNQDQNSRVAAQFRSSVSIAEKEMDLSLRSRHPMHLEKYGALVPSKTYKVTPFILYACALVYLVMVLFGVPPLTPNAMELYDWGGNFLPAVMDGQWWRLVTYMFLHAGAMHLVMNGFALLYVGMFLEPLIGKLRLASAYLLTGVFAGIMSLMVHGNSVAVGASGAIFGLYGVFFSLLTTNYLQKTAKTTMMRSLLFFVVFNLLMGMQGNTDNAAHIGGLISGILIGYIFYPGIRNNSSRAKQVALVSILSVCTVLICWLALV